MQLPLLTNLGVTLLISLILAVNSEAERVTFSEIHYAPKDDKPEYIELFNNSGSAVDFACWEFSDGIDYKGVIRGSLKKKHIFIKSQLIPKYI